MAGDWMKVEKATPDKPEIALLARILQVSQGEAFLEWFRVYAWADGICSDGAVPHLSLCDGDTLSRARPGTCEALADKRIGWINETPDGLTFNAWARHNGKSAKARALDTEKKRRSRSASRSCPDANGTGSGPEKRREEKSNSIPPSPPNTSHNAPGRNGGGGGGFLGAGWEDVAARLQTLGIADAVTACVTAEANGLTPDQVAAIANVWEAARGAWRPGALHWRITHAVPGQDAADGWPERDTPAAADSWQERTRRQTVNREGERMQFTKQLRAAGKSPEEVDAELAAAGFEV